MSDLFDDIDKQYKEEPPNKTIVRLRRSAWHDNDGVYEKISLKYLKRQTKGFNIFDDDCRMAGADGAVRKIVNLSLCDDGLYELQTCNHSTDWETGIVDDWDYILVPYNKT